ncbi:MAG: hypothetical protein P8O16_16235 [Algoriphagus sp.]|uniref:hypothetical protein n=1 Tax=Algoriphagus sp. TaxID=1872435 RepID=UPI002606369F|nr:hypothetical protein [Algoriphagus sp.]MDG1278832.1 hypothetical protein [Algoriphagus sp.]
MNFNWNEFSLSDEYSSEILSQSKILDFSNSKIIIREKYKLEFYDFIRDPLKSEKVSKEIYGGIPSKDERRKNSKTYGDSNSSFIGFLDNATPCRIKPRGNLSRFHEDGLGSVWFRLDTAFKDKNKTKCFNGATDTRSYCAYDLNSAKNVFSWFAITKCLDNYPLWANQFDIWAPEIKPELADYWHSLCFAFVLSENRCVVTKFEANNPVAGAPEVFVDNPLSTNNPESFWNTTLDNQIVLKPELAYKLVEKIKELYQVWNYNYCKGDILENVGLHDEPYFKYFDYPDFLTKNSGLIQIKKYAMIHNNGDLGVLFQEISSLTKMVKAELYRLLVEEFGYFG